MPSPVQPSASSAVVLALTARPAVISDESCVDPSWNSPVTSAARRWRKGLLSARTAHRRRFASLLLSRYRAPPLPPQRYRALLQRHGPYRASPFRCHGPICATVCAGGIDRVRNDGAQTRRPVHRSPRGWSSGGRLLPSLGSGSQDERRRWCPPRSGLRFLLLRNGCRAGEPQGPFASPRSGDPAYAPR